MEQKVEKRLEQLETVVEKQQQKINKLEKEVEELKAISKVE